MEKRVLVHLPSLSSVLLFPQLKPFYQYVPKFVCTFGMTSKFSEPFSGAGIPEAMSSAQPGHPAACRAANPGASASLCPQQCLRNNIVSRSFQMKLL